VAAIISVHIFRSHGQISAGHADLIRALVEHTIRLTIVLASFHTEFAKFTSIQTKIGQKELCGLSGKIHDLDNLMRE